jgi:hypothetical protein
MAAAVRGSGGSVEALLAAVALVWVLGGVIAFAVWRGRKARMIQAVPPEQRRRILLGGALACVVGVIALALYVALS